MRHQGKKELTASVGEWNVDGFQQAIAGFSSQIRDATDPALHETLVCDFSTTTPAVRTASEIALMDTYASYFSYVMLCVCDIPSITLTGSLDDWERIRARIEVLETFRLDWWVSRVRPILDEFVKTVGGHPNPEFWKAIYKPARAYAATMVTGWIADLFPYVGQAPRYVQNPSLKQPRVGWAVPMENKDDFGDRLGGPVGSVSTKSFPAGLSRVPVKLAFPDGQTHDADLLGGFFAVEQDQANQALSPYMSWCVAVPPPEKPVPVLP